jgi:RND family efflux transporter MFP subunit
MRALWIVGIFLALGTPSALAETFTTTSQVVSDEKAVFATVESRNVEPARARIGGTVVALAVKQGDEVTEGQVVATVADEKLLLQIKSLDALIAGLEAQLAQAQTDLSRAEDLFSKGTIPKTRLDEVRTAFNVASNSHRSKLAEKAVIEQQMAEGKVFAPISGRVLTVPVTVGTVTLSGEAVATIAEKDFVLRLRVPEWHARFLKTGDPVRVDSEALGANGASFGAIRLVYPQIQDGRVVADAKVSGLGDYFVGERILVWVSSGSRSTVVVPSAYIVTRFGVDYARMQQGSAIIDVPVQRGRDLPRPEMPDGLEILSGLKAGDVLVGP